MGFNLAIANLALNRLGSNIIRSLTEQSTEAIRVNGVYELLRKFMLAEYDWPFARKVALLELTAEADLRYTYVYRKPANCVTAIRVLNPDEFFTVQNFLSQQKLPIFTSMKIDYAQGVSDTGTFSTIMSNEANASLVYTAEVLNDAIFPAKFVDAFAWRIAAELAIPLKGKSDLADSCSKRFIAALSSAGMRAANEENVETPDQNDIANSRL